LQVHDTIATLCTSSLRKQLTRTQQQHAPPTRALLAPLQKHAHTSQLTAAQYSKSTHKGERLKCQREHNPLQVHDTIVLLCTSSLRKQLTRTQQQHAPQTQALLQKHAHTSKPK